MADVQELLAGLVALPSVTGGEPAEAQAAAAIGDLVRAECGPDVDDVNVMVGSMALADLAKDPAYPGIETPRTYAHYVIARIEGTAPPDGSMEPVGLILNGHFDVVPVPPADAKTGQVEGWDTPPFVCTTMGDELRGRGVCDMKGGLAAAIRVFVAMSKRRSTWRGALVLLAVSGEEDGGTGCLAAIRQHGTEPDGLLRGVTAVVIPEPTRLDAVLTKPPSLVVAHAGCVSVQISLEGRAAHASRRTQGVSALAGVPVVLEALQLYEDRINKQETDPILTRVNNGMPYPVSVGEIHGGNWTSTVMDHVALDVRVGIPYALGAAEALDAFRTAITEYTAQHGDAWLREHPPRIEHTGALFCGARAASDSTIVRCMRRALAAEYGIAEADAALDPVAVPYGCDLRFFVRELGLDVVVCGPGEIDWAHAANERVAIADLCAYDRVLEQAATAFLSCRPTDAT